MSLKMYSLLNIMTYMMGPTTTILCFVLALLLSYLVNMLYKSTIIYKLYWKKFVSGKENRRLLRTCAPFSFNLGFNGMARAILSLQMWWYHTQHINDVAFGRILTILNIIYFGVHKKVTEFASIYLNKKIR